MKVLWIIVKSIIIRAISFATGAFLAGAFSAMFEVEISDLHMYRIMGLLFIGLEIALWKWELPKKETESSEGLKKSNYNEITEPVKTEEEGIDSDNAVEIETQVEEAVAKDAVTDTETVAEDLSSRMSGSLVALYKDTHDKKYDEEYRRRLGKIGFSEREAANMFMFELMILKHDNQIALKDPQYIYRPMLDYRSMPLHEEDSWYVEHQMFLMSEIVKLWDEAEYVWTNSNKYLEDEQIRKRVYSLTRYGGAKLFLSYLRMISEKAHTDIKLVQAYARAEQDLLYIYRWKQEGVEYPY